VEEEKEKRKKRSLSKAVMIGCIVVIFVLTVTKFLKALFTMLSHL